MIFRAVRSRCNALDTATSAWIRAGLKGYTSLNIARSASRVSRTSMISCRTWAVFSKASSSSARQASSLGRKHPLLGDEREVAVLQGDRVEPAFPVRQHIGEVELLDAGDVLADQVAKVTLAGDEADDRHRAVGLPGLDQLGQLVPLGLDEVQVRRVRGQPEDQLVEEQDQAVVAERLGMGADDAEARRRDRRRLRPCPERSP